MGQVVRGAQLHKNMLILARHAFSQPGKVVGEKSFQARRLQDYLDKLPLVSLEQAILEHVGLDHQFVP